MFKTILRITLLALLYFLIRPSIKTKAQRKSFLKSFIVIIPLVLVGYWMFNFYVSLQKPEAFEKGVELLKNNKDILRKTGAYQSYYYLQRDLPKKTDNPASFKVAIKGTIATAFLSCKIKKDSSGQWLWLEVKLDSLKK
jgi:hypothetical protein